MTDANEGVAGDPQRAAQLYKQGCDGGNSLACFRLAIRYGAGRGVAKDRARAGALLKQACEGGIQDACLALNSLMSHP